MAKAKIGIIGGTGLYQMEGLTKVEEIKVKTPFGEPSDAILIGSLEGVEVAFLPRHGKGHHIQPAEIPSRANIYALKSLGVERIISVTAVGSLREEIRPSDLVIPDQLVDRTWNRVSTFFGDGIVVHVAFAEPFCPDLNRILYEAAKEVGVRVHKKGTHLVMEGPQFSTKAESFLHRSWGVDTINMTTLPEAKLAREAEICYSTLACVTDYDAWHGVYESVTVEIVIANLKKSMETARKVLRAAIGRIGEPRGCLCPTALKNAIITSPYLIPEKAKRDLDLLIGKYIK